MSAPGHLSLLCVRLCGALEGVCASPPPLALIVVLSCAPDDFAGTALLEAYGYWSIGAAAAVLMAVLAFLIRIRAITP